MPSISPAEIEKETPRMIGRSTPRMPKTTFSALMWPLGVGKAVGAVSAGCLSNSICMSSLLMCDFIVIVCSGVMVFRVFMMMSMLFCVVVDAVVGVGLSGLWPLLFLENALVLVVVVGEGAMCHCQ